MPRPPRFHLLSTLALAAAIAAPSFALAQDSPPVPSGKRGIPQQPPPSKPRDRGPIVSVDFSGGTVGEYIAAVIQSAAPTPINVVVMPEAKDVQMGPLSLKNVTVETALEGLSFVFDRSGEHQFAANQISSNADESGEALTFVVHYQNQRSRQAPQPQMMFPRTSKVRSIRSLVEMPDGSPGGEGQTIPIDNILNALRIAAEMERNESNGPPPPEFMLHKDSLLLIARGTPDQHNMVEQVLAELENNVMQRRSEARKAQSDTTAAELQAVALEADLTNAEAQMMRCQSELGPARTILNQLTAQAASGSVSQMEVERARAQLGVAEANQAAARANFEAVHKRMEIIRRQGAGGGASRPVPTEERTLVIYDVRDLKDFRADILEMCNLVSREQADKDHTRVEVKPASGDSTGSIVVKGTPEQHRILVQFFNTARRLKTNEPKLPGLNPEDVIKGSTKE